MNHKSDIEEPALFFLAGMSRAGITWLSRALNRHPEIAVFGQSRFWGKHFVTPNSDGFYEPKHLDRVIAKIYAFEWNATIGAGHGCIPNIGLDEFRNLLASSVEHLPAKSTPVSVYKAMAAAVANLQGASIVIEKTPHHVLHVQRILRAFPDTRLLLLRAEPFEHMAVLKAQTDLKYHPLAAALIWKKYDAAIKHSVVNYPAHTRVVEAFELADQPEATLEKLEDYLGIHDFEWMNGMSAFDFGVPNAILPELDEADYYWSRIINYESLSNFNSAHINKRVLYSLGTLPAYISHNIQVSIREVEGSLFRYYYRWLFRNSP